MSSVVKCQHCLLVLCLCNYVTPPWYRASGSNPAAPVLAGPLFLKSKSKIPFLNLASNKQKCYFDLLGLLYQAIIDIKNIPRGARSSAICALNLLLYSQGIRVPV